MSRSLIDAEPRGAVCFGRKQHRDARSNFSPWIFSVGFYHTEPMVASEVPKPALKGIALVAFFS